LQQVLENCRDRTPPVKRRQECHRANPARSLQIGIPFCYYHRCGASRIRVRGKGWTHLPPDCISSEPLCSRYCGPSAL